MKVAAVNSPGEMREFVRVLPPAVEASTPVVGAVSTSTEGGGNPDTRESLKRFLRLVKKASAAPPRGERGLEGYQAQCTSTTGTKGLYLDKFC